MEDKLAMVRESFEAGKTVSMVASPARRQSEPAVPLAKAAPERQPLGGQLRRRNRSSLGAWRRAQANTGTTAAARQENDGERNCPLSHGGREVARMDCARALVAGGRAVKRVCEVLRRRSLQRLSSTVRGAQRHINRVVWAPAPYQIAPDKVGRLTFASAPRPRGRTGRCSAFEMRFAGIESLCQSVH